MITNEQYDAAKQLRAAGMTYKQIGEALGLSTTTIWNNLALHRMGDIGRPKKYVDERMKEIVKDSIKRYFDGETLQDIADSYRISKSTLVNWRKMYFKEIA